MKTIRIFPVLFAFLLLFSCQKDTSSLSQEEIATGLKSALEVGVDYALTSLGGTDGFLNDQLVKIGLPEDASNLISQAIALNPFTGSIIKAAEDELITTLNKAAEVSIKEVVPIVIDAVQTMTIQDAQSLLFSSSNIAATNYLKEKSYSNLSSACKPVIEGSLSKKLVGNTSAQDAWKTLITQYNVAASILNLDKIETNLATYATEKTLDGVFTKIGVEEQNIRTNSTARINDILKKVFALID